MTLKEQHENKLRAHRQYLTGELERIRALLPTLGIQKAILFGSLARGDDIHLGSDIDLALIVESDLPWSRRQDEFYGKIVPRGADILVYTPEEFEIITQRVFGRRILREGKILYEAGT